MPTDTVIDTVASEKLHVFALYADFDASARARKVVGMVTRLAGPFWQVAAQTWKLDTLAASGPIKRMINDDAANADVLVIAVSSLAQQPQDLIDWLDSLAVLKRNAAARGLVIGLLGDDGDRELNWTVTQLIRCAQQSNRDFIWHWMEEGTDDDLDWLTDNGGLLSAPRHSRYDQAVCSE